eukprot:scaffold2156_cov430-Prasinococcus_capsulatus_cf.AAC.6
MAYSHLTPLATLGCRTKHSRNRPDPCGHAHDEIPPGTAHEACAELDSRKLYGCLGAGDDMDEKLQGMTPLWVAIYFSTTKGFHDESVALVQLLLRQGTLPSRRVPGATVPLDGAARREDGLTAAPVALV